MFIKFFKGALGVFAAYLFLWVLIPIITVLAFLFVGYLLLG